MEYFKYRPSKGDFALRILENNELYFSTPDTFNDPFDCAIHFDYSVVSEAYLEKIVDRYIAELPFDDATKQKIKHEKIEGMRKERNDLTSNSYKSQLAYINRTIGIFCFSKRCDSIPMWAYYAEGHQGLCLGISSTYIDSLIEYLNQKFKGTPKFIELKNVDYIREYPIVNPETESEENKFYAPLISKSENWNHEEEVRLIWADGPNHFISVDDEIFTRVMLGLNATQGFENKIKDILKSKKHSIPLFKAVRQQRAYGIKFERIM